MQNNTSTPAPVQPCYGLGEAFQLRRKIIKFFEFKNEKKSTNTIPKYFFLKTRWRNCTLSEITVQSYIYSCSYHMSFGIFYSQLHLNGGVLILYNSCMEMFLPDVQSFPRVQHLSHFQYLSSWGVLLWAFLHRSLFSNRIISQEWKFRVKR